MKKMSLLLVLGWLTASVLAGQVVFQSPSYEAPYYHLGFSLLVQGEPLRVMDVQVNDRTVGGLQIFKEGKAAGLDKALEPGRYECWIDYAWAGNTAYRLRVRARTAMNGPDTTLEFKDQSPRTGGIPRAEEGFYRLYRVEEEAGLERRGEIVLLTLTAPKAEVDEPSFCLFDGERPIPFQVLDRGESLPPEAVRSTHPVTLTYQLAAALDVRPHERKLLLVLKGPSAMAQKSPFQISGQGLGKTVANTSLSLGFSPKSGQVNTIRDLKNDIALHNRAGVIHWNPDIFVPGLAWDHSFDWNPPQSFEERTGGLLYVNRRRGPMPRIPDAYLEVKYTLEKDAPYLISETRLLARKDLGVIAARNDEMVLSKDLFDSLGYKDKQGRIIQLPLKEMPGHPNGVVHIAPDDLDWVGLVNTRRGFGFFSLRLAYDNGNPSSSGSPLHRAGTYFYAPSDGDYVYWVRALLYTWAEYTTSNQLVFLPEGSSFYEKNAYIVLPLTPGWPERLDRLQKRLKNPLRVY